MIAAIVTVAERPDLIEAIWEMPSPWPPFMLEDPVVGMFWDQLPVAFPEYQLLALDADDNFSCLVPPTTRQPCSRRCASSARRCTAEQ